MPPNQEAIAKNLAEDRDFALQCLSLGLVDAATISRLVAVIKQQNFAVRLPDLMIQEGLIDKLKAQELRQQSQAQVPQRIETRSTTALLPNIPGFNVLKKLKCERGLDKYLVENGDRSREVLYLLPAKITPNSAEAKKIRQIWSQIKALNHSMIATANLMGEFNNRLFLTREYVAGSTLEDLIQRRQIFPREVALGFVSVLANVIEFAHERQILHNDINPSTVVFLPNRQVKFQDFGIERQIMDIAGLEDPDSLTCFRSPEDLRENQSGSANDLFSLGAILFFAVSGKRPPRAQRTKNVAITEIDKIAPNLDAELTSVIARLLLPRLARIATIQELRQALKEANDPKAKAATPTTANPNDQDNIGTVYMGFGASPAPAGYRADQTPRKYKQTSRVNGVSSDDATVISDEFSKVIQDHKDSVRGLNAPMPTSSSASHGDADPGAATVIEGATTPHFSSQESDPGAATVIEGQTSPYFNSQRSSPGADTIIETAAPRTGRALPPTMYVSGEADPSAETIVGQDLANSVAQSYGSVHSDTETLVQDSPFGQNLHMSGESDPGAATIIESQGFLASAGPTTNPADPNATLLDAPNPHMVSGEADPGAATVINAPPISQPQPLADPEAATLLDAPSPLPQNNPAPQNFDAAGATLIMDEPDQSSGSHNALNQATPKSTPAASASGSNAGTTPASGIQSGSSSRTSTPASSKSGHSGASGSATASRFRSSHNSDLCNGFKILSKPTDVGPWQRYEAERRKDHLMVRLYLGDHLELTAQQNCYLALEPLIKEPLQRWPAYLAMDTSVDERVFIAQEALEGQSLNSLDRFGKMEFLEGAHLLKQIVAALLECEKAGFAPSSLSVEDIMLTFHDGQEVIRVANGPHHSDAPDFEGKPLLTVKQQIHAVGVIAYQLFTGQNPAESSQAKAKELSALRPGWAPPSDLTQFCLKAVNSSKKGFESLSDLDNALKNIRATKEEMGRGNKVLLSLVCLLLLVIVGVFAIHFLSPETIPEPISGLLKSMLGQQ